MLGSGFKAESGRERIHMAAGELVPWSGLPEKGPQGEKDKPYGRRPIKKPQHQRGGGRGSQGARPSAWWQSSSEFPQDRAWGAGRHVWKSSRGTRKGHRGGGSQQRTDRRADEPQGQLDLSPT